MEVVQVLLGYVLRSLVVTMGERHLGWEESGHGLNSRPRRPSLRVMPHEMLFFAWLPSTF